MKAAYRFSLPEPIKKSLDACWKDGVAAQVTIGIFDTFLIPYALFLNATPRQIGWMVGLPSLLSSLSQLLVPQTLSLLGGSRRKLVVWGMALQGWLLLPLPLMLLFPIPEK